MASLSKENPIYQIPQSGRMPTRTAPSRDAAGLPVTEKVTKLPYRLALNPQGNLVRIPLSNAPAIRSIKTQYGNNLADWLPRLGIVWADCCPVESTNLKRSDIERMFGKAASPCEGVFNEDRQCAHIVELQGIRRAMHEKKQRLSEASAATIEQLLKEEFLDRKRAEIERDAAKAVGKGKGKGK